MACNPSITPAKAKQLVEQAEKQIAAGDVINGQHALKIAQLLEAATLSPVGSFPILSVKEVIVAGLKAGSDKQSILAAVKIAFPDSKAGPNDIAYYKSKLKKAGELPDQPSVTGFKAPWTPPPALTAVELLEELDDSAAFKMKLVLKDILDDHDIDVPADDMAKFFMTNSVNDVNAIKDAIDELGALSDTGDTQKLLDALQTQFPGMLSTEAFDKAVTKIALNLQKKLDSVVVTASQRGFDVDAAAFGSEDEINNLIAKLGEFYADPTQANLLAIKDLGVSITKAANIHGLSPFSMIENPNTIADVIMHGLKQGKSETNILADVKVFFPNSKTGPNSVAYYKTHLKKTGELPGYKGKSASATPPTPGYPAATPSTPIGVITRAETVAGDVIMGVNQNVPLGGSNNAQLWLGKDGTKRVVKFYPDPQQGYQEHLSNQLYRQLGHNAPESGVFTHQGKVGYWSRYEEGVKKFVLNETNANQVLDGFAADILTANWDVMGLSMDNVGLVNGKVMRLDNGSSFLFRAQAGKRKPDGILNQITEFEKFADGSNPSYLKVFNTLGTSPVQMGERLIQQIDKIEALQNKVGSWKLFVDDIVRGSGMNAADRLKIEMMLQQRANLLYAKRQVIRDQLALLTRRTQGRGQAFAEIAARQRNITDEVKTARYRQRIDAEISRAGSSYTTPGSVKAKLAKPTTLSSHDSEREAIVRLRDQIMREEFSNNAAVWKHYHEYESAISSWYGSSSGQGAARLKRALEETFPGEVNTSYHGVFLNHDPNLRKTYLLSQAPENLIPAFKAFMEVDRQFAKAYVREVMGKDTITLYRGVSGDYFRKQGVPKPTKGEEVVVIGNPMDSWSFQEGAARRFAGYDGVVFQAEISVDDMQSLFIQQKGANSYWSEKEVFVIGKPQRAKVK